MAVEARKSKTQWQSGGTVSTAGSDQAIRRGTPSRESAKCYYPCPHLASGKRSDTVRGRLHRQNLCKLETADGEVLV